MTASHLAAYMMNFLKSLTSHDEKPWVPTDEPHAERRKQILNKYPQIKKLMGPEPRLAFWITVEVIVQITLCWIVRDQSWTAVLICAYVLGAFLNISLVNAIHETSHNLAFGHTWLLSNSILGMFANLPLGIPISSFFKKYHAYHHHYLGNKRFDVAVLSKIENIMLQYRMLRAAWLVMQIVFYRIRPLVAFPLPIQKMDILNMVLQGMFNYTILCCFGVKSLVYLVMGTAFSFSIHPAAGQTISGHNYFSQPETFSYYGSMNKIMFNVGYHVEHHDFPYIPYSRLPEVRRIAKEFYEDLPYCTSWSRVVWDFVMKPEITQLAKEK